MRTIKFRAWDKKNNCWFKQKNPQGDRLDKHYLSLDGWLWDKKHINSDNSDENDSLSKEEFELQQFVGISDVNGKDIYEGDIIKYRSMDNIPWRFGTIKIIGGGKTATALETKIDTTDGYLYPLSNEREFPVTKSEVVGNIFENPKLLSK